MKRIRVDHDHFPYIIDLPDNCAFCIIVFFSAECKTMVILHDCAFSVALTGYGAALFYQAVYGKITCISMGNKAGLSYGMEGTIKLNLIHVRIKLFPVETDFLVKQFLTHNAP